MNSIRNFNVRVRLHGSTTLHTHIKGRGVARVEGQWGRRPPKDFEEKNLVGCLSLSEGMKEKKRM